MDVALGGKSKGASSGGSSNYIESPSTSTYRLHFQGPIVFLTLRPTPLGLHKRSRNNILILFVYIYVSAMFFFYVCMNCVNLQIYGYSSASTVIIICSFY